MLVAAGCEMSVESTAPATTAPSAADVAASELAPNDGPTGPLAFSSNDSVLVGDGRGSGTVELREGPDLTYTIIAELDPGMTVVPTGLAGASAAGAWVEVDVPSLAVRGFVPRDSVADPSRSGQRSIGSTTG